MKMTSRLKTTLKNEDDLQNEDDLKNENNLVGIVTTCKLVKALENAWTKQKLPPLWQNTKLFPFFSRRLSLSKIYY